MIPRALPVRRAAAWLTLAALLVSGAGCAPLTGAFAGLAAAQTAPAVTLKPLVRGLDQPTDVVNAHDGSGRLFVVQKGGRIRVVQGGSVLPGPFLDLTSLVNSSGSEQGLLGLAFHPRYQDNGLFYVNYTDGNGGTVVARYQVSADPSVADPGSGKRILFQSQPFANHNGGNLMFGPDGYLYIGLGDGGSGGDPFGNGQNGGTLLGKMLRIDVDGGDPYGIPSDNPFVNTPGFAPEVWAYGLRNPWRYSFDRASGDLWIGDVGQDRWEEVDLQPAGAGGQNYGWNRMEGTHCYQPSSGCDTSGLTMPVADYGHNLGCSITGGYVYRGAAYPSLQGMYLFADYCSGRIWSLTANGDGTYSRNDLLTSKVNISSFGEDEAGEVYITGISDGTLYQVTAGS